MGPDDWWKSKCNNLVPKISLDPKKRPKSNLAHFNTELLSNRESTVPNSQNNQSAQNTEVPKIKSPSTDEQVEFESLIQLSISLFTIINFSIINYKCISFNVFHSSCFNV